MVKEGWFILPGTSYEIPVPPRDLYIAIATVLLFIPVVTIVARLIAPLLRRKPDHAKKRA